MGIVPLKPEDDEMRVEYYEGLVKKTAGKYHAIVQEEYEDMCQILRLKVFQALESFKPEKSRVPAANYVFSCVRNQVKDLFKRKRRDELLIEDIAPSVDTNGYGREFTGLTDTFDSKYMRLDEDEVFAEILRETPLIPSTLTDTERGVLVGLYLEYQQKDIAERLGITIREVARAVKAIKVKMADWKPSSTGSVPEGCDPVGEVN